MNLQFMMEQSIMKLELRNRKETIEEFVEFISESNLIDPDSLTMLKDQLERIELQLALP